MKLPVRLPLSRSASTCVLTLVSFGKDESVTKRMLESIEDEGGDSVSNNSLFVSFQSVFFSNGLLQVAVVGVGRVRCRF